MDLYFLFGVFLAANWSWVVNFIVWGIFIFLSTQLVFFSMVYFFNITQNVHASVFFFNFSPNYPSPPLSEMRKLKLYNLGNFQGFTECNRFSWLQSKYHIQKCKFIIVLAPLALNFFFWKLLSRFTQHIFVDNIINCFSLF